MSSLRTYTEADKPTSPTAGETIYLTDVNKIAVYDGDASDWKLFNADSLEYSTSNELHYTGSAMGFTSTDGSVPYYCPQPQLHLNSTYIAGTGSGPGTGTTAATWSDISGNSNDAAQTNAAWQPTYYKDSANNGFLSFGGLDYYNLSSTITISGDFTQIFVGQRQSEKDHITSAGGSGYYLIHKRGGAYHVYKPLTTGHTPETVSGTAPYLTNEMWTAQRGTVDGAANTVSLAIAGGNVSSAHTFVNTDTKNMTWIASSGSFKHIGQYYELLHWDSKLGTDDLNRVRLYLTNKYGLTTTAFL
jgi:hypothetical protein